MFYTAVVLHEATHTHTLSHKTAHAHTRAHTHTHTHTHSAVARHADRLISWTEVKDERLGNGGDAAVFFSKGAKNTFISKMRKKTLLEVYIEWVFTMTVFKFVVVMKKALLLLFYSCMNMN